MVYQTEKTLGEVGDKITEDEKKGIQDEVDKLRELLKAQPIDTEAVKKQTEEVQQKFYKVSEKLYAAAQAEAQAAQQAQQQNGSAASDNDKKDDNVVDADYTDVD